MHGGVAGGVHGLDVLVDGGGVGVVEVSEGPEVVRQSVGQSASDTGSSLNLTIRSLGSSKTLHAQ